MLSPVCKLYRSNAGTFRSADGKRIIHGLPKGFPDLFGVILKDKSADGIAHSVFIECKIKPNKPSDEQKAFVAEYGDGGCVCGICYTISEACRLVRPLLKDGDKVFPDSVLERWDEMYK